MRFTLTPVFEEYGFSVYVPEGFRVEQKELPPEVERSKEIHWFGSFKLVHKSGDTPPKLDFKYEIQVRKEEGMHGLVFWDNEYIVPLTEEFHDLREIIPLEGEPYFRAKLSLTDPPCGWR